MQVEVFRFHRSDSCSNRLRGGPKQDVGEAMLLIWTADRRRHQRRW